jgi:hypothetical protein
VCAGAGRHGADGVSTVQHDRRQPERENGPRSATSASVESPSDHSTCATQSGVTSRISGHAIPGSSASAVLAAARACPACSAG